MKSWLPIAAESDFSIYNLPFGIYSQNGGKKHVGVAIGDKVVNLFGLSENQMLDVASTFFAQDYLNDFIRLGKNVTRKVRLDVQRLLCEEDSPLRASPELLIDQSEVQMHLPVRIGDYTDFYSSIEHATNVGVMFRDPEHALLPNWKHIPVGYHGRASSIVVSGVPIHRPMGQVLPKDATEPVFAASSRVDFELEMGYIIGKDTSLGDRVSTAEAEEYIFGKVLFNDWSARDIQKWEYVPLGPFLAKNFGSSVSPWVVTMEALEPFRVAGPKQETKVLPYLEATGDRNFDIQLEVAISPEGSEEQVVSRSNFKHMYWNMAQQLAHHTVNGCDVHVGDMMASGTISGPTPDAYGSMLELAWAGTKPIEMRDGTVRRFIEDGDTVTMRGYADKDGVRVGFGEVSAQILPAKAY
ncbi:fumarylacetoacetase [Reichenbachiella agariperforans]|uniref:fumarylacetoacetase n=1 Tax=Reichenbachiella agariperforans TaxID=156994 RepID=UPI001C087C98|nr:fumarylacetoacetase [Reichenbachiella agariperforans]MBU2914873.1 fumarylacetoacetase [Reichenbachiella agariperforans]